MRVLLSLLVALGIVDLIVFVVALCQLSASDEPLVPSFLSGDQSYLVTSFVDPAIANAGSSAHDEGILRVGIRESSQIVLWRCI